jgi:hypothetical protein
MIIRKYPTDGLKGQQQSAQGIALGMRGGITRPERAKAFRNSLIVNQ